MNPESDQDIKIIHKQENRSIISLDQPSYVRRLTVAAACIF
ncbi:hypothetical protein DSUL_100020 [Desulfovibrionales bacterium]